MASSHYLVMGTVGATSSSSDRVAVSDDGQLNLADMGQRLRWSATRPVLAAIGLPDRRVSLKLALFPLRHRFQRLHLCATAVSAYLAATATKVAVYVRCASTTRCSARPSVSSIAIQAMLLLLALGRMFVASAFAIYHDTSSACSPIPAWHRSATSSSDSRWKTPPDSSAAIVHLFNHGDHQGRHLHASG